MIAHIGLIVSDIERSKYFYSAALKPISYQTIREYGVTSSRPAASAGFGEPPRADLWIYQGDPGKDNTHMAFQVNRQALVDVVYQRRWRPEARTMANPGCGRSTAPITTAPSSSIPMVTMSKPCAEKLNKQRRLRATRLRAKQL